MRNLRVSLKSKSQVRRARRGATTLEYVLILGGVVIPLILLTPIAMRMLNNYGHRMHNGLYLPFP